MNLSRRAFLRAAGAGTLGVAVAEASDRNAYAAPPNALAMLIDTTHCVGCRQCEWACARQHGLTDLPVKAFEDTSVFQEERRMTDRSLTVVNRYPNPKEPTKPIHVKFQCMHCNAPACASACLVGALRKTAQGPVTYDAFKCMGCRYCMVACPFQVPAYEYGNAFTPRVRKCDLCVERIDREGGIPACVEICPLNCIKFGPRATLLEWAHHAITENPERYVPHVYGEQEVGGTSVFYLASRAFGDIGLLDLGEAPIPKLTETLQHSIFKYGLPPAMLFGLLGCAMWVMKERDTTQNPDAPTAKE